MRSLSGPLYGDSFSLNLSRTIEVVVGGFAESSWRRCTRVVFSSAMSRTSVERAPCSWRLMSFHPKSIHWIACLIASLLLLLLVCCSVSRGSIFGACCGTTIPRPGFNQKFQKLRCIQKGGISACTVIAYAAE